MNRSLLVFALLLLFSTSAWSETIPAADGRITYIGRTLTKGGTVSFDWTGVYLKVRFQGTSLRLKASDTKRNYYNLWLDSTMDQAPDKVITIEGKDTTITLCSLERKAAKKPHQVILQKRTEGEQGCTTIESFTTDGIFLQADPPKDRVIEFIGDSYTCGYGTEASNKERFSPETENQNLTYACATARYFGAEHIVVAHSGYGIIRNYNGPLTEDHMPGRYLRTFDLSPEPAWNPDNSCLKPDISVIYLGTNDFSTRMQPAERAFVKNYILLLKEIKDFYGDNHPILCIAPKHDLLIFEYIKKAVDTGGFQDVYLLGLGNGIHSDDGRDLGADSHPNHNGHLKIAHSVIPYISTITNWEMTSNPIR